MQGIPKRILWHYFVLVISGNNLSDSGVDSQQLKVCKQNFKAESRPGKSPLSNSAITAALVTRRSV
jgi:hypothetical protein